MQTGTPLNIAALLPAGMTMDTLYILMAALAAFITVYAVGGTFVQRDKMGPRLKALKERRAQLKEEAIGPRRRKQSDNKIDFIRSITIRFKLVQKEQAGKMNKNLIAAGYRSKDAIHVYAFAKLIAPFALLFLSFFLVKIDFTNPAASGWKLFVPIAMMYFGLRLPDIMVANARTKRWQMIRKALPDTLDLMMICAEAGLSLSAALDRVSRELGLAYPEMADEMALTSVELGFLPDRKKALSNMAERVDIQEIRGMVSVLIQTEKYGTPISQALRVLSSEFRTQRMLRAEQKAARLPAIMTIPMIVFILPTLFVVIISPAIIKLMDTL